MAFTIILFHVCKLEIVDGSRGSTFLHAAPCFLLLFFLPILLFFTIVVFIFLSAMVIWSLRLFLLFLSSAVLSKVCTVLLVHVLLVFLFSVPRLRIDRC